MLGIISSNLMIKLYVLIIICLSGYIVFRSRRFRALSRAWREKFFPDRKKKLTMFDVRRLIIKGEKDLAVRVYSDLFNASPQEAGQAVEELERSIQPKDFEF